MKNKLYIGMGVLMLFTLSSCSTPTSENAQIQRLNKQVEEQQKQIEQLKSASSSTDSIKQNISAGWIYARNWENIQRGMSPQQVSAILGQPTRTDKSIGLTLFWEGNVSGSGFVSGHVWFYQNQVSSISPPVFFDQ